MKDPVYVIQEALRKCADHSPDNPEQLYKPSPGQLLDHIHHRIASIAIDALVQEGIIIRDYENEDE